MYITMVRLKNVIKASILSFVIGIICDVYLFPTLFSNVVHSRYFSLRCKEQNDASCKEIDALFLTRNKNCEDRASTYWMNQPRKQRTKRPLYDDELNRYWSDDMAEFLDYNNQDTVDLLVMIISVRRRHGSYLQHVTRLLHQQIQKINNRDKNMQKRKANLVICNSDAELDEHKEAMYLSNFVDVIPINRTKRSHKCCPAENW